MGLSQVMRRLLPEGPETMSYLALLRHEATFLKSRKGWLSRQGMKDTLQLTPDAGDFLGGQLP